ncbi:ABC transporter permease [Streptomyces sp. NPDC085481]|uniref:ABC transporter permease n=1 Tax=Streptomyces sp. NPDC085481 TaxID=3365727 RepID=UPI0037D162AE
MLLSPRHRLPLWAGRALPYVLNGLLVGAFVLTVAVTVLGLPVPAGAPPGIGLVLLVAAVACSASGLVLGALGLRFRDVFLVPQAASSALLLLTGAAVPRDTLPGTPSCDAPASRGEGEERCDVERRSDEEERRKGEYRPSS